MLLANLGAVQARRAGIAAVADAVAGVDADVLCVHLNPAQELVQDEGDRDFRGCLDTLEELAAALPVPLLVKETGCGLSPRAAARLCGVGVGWVDISGAGGTSWTAVEALRGSPRQRRLGRALREWGIPTAAAIAYARRAGLRTIASGGIRDGVDAAKALALGAEAVGLALPFLRAYAAGGAAGLRDEAGALTDALRAVMLLTGTRRVADLSRAPRVLGPALRGWLRGEPHGA